MWLSFHIFCHDTSKHDDLIGQCALQVEKLIEKGKLNQWFYIRYWIGGPHIRLRISTTKLFKTHDKIAFLNVLKRINTLNNQFQIDKNLYYLNNKAGLNETTLEEKNYPWYRSGSVLETVYEPENIRYGGEALIELSEQGFYHSSMLALTLNKLSCSKRILMSATITKYITDRIISEKPRDIYIEAAKNWKNTFSLTTNMKTKTKIAKIINKSTLDQVNSFIGGNEILEAYLLLLKTIQIEIQNEAYFKAILFSHFHMLNNRIAISPAMEMVMFENIAEISDKIGEDI